MPQPESAEKLDEGKIDDHRPSGLLGLSAVLPTWTTVGRYSISPAITPVPGQPGQVHGSLSGATVSIFLVTYIWILVQCQSPGLHLKSGERIFVVGE